LDDVENTPVGLFFPPTIFVFPPKKEMRLLTAPLFPLNTVPLCWLQNGSFTNYLRGIIYDDESVFEEEAKIKKRHNLKLLVAVTIYCEESKHLRKRMKKEHSGDERNRRDNVNTKATFCMPPRNAREIS
jgi:hypothetical protein